MGEVYRARDPRLVSSDGQKFLINTRIDETNAAPLSIVLNWASELQK
jgi:hypothetical protein